MNMLETMAVNASDHKDREAVYAKRAELVQAIAETGRIQPADLAELDRLGQQWDVPPGAKPMKEASLSIEVHSNGNFKAAMVTSSSGDRQFDRSAIKAIAKALPIPEWRSLSTRTRERLSRFKLNLGPRGEEKAQSNQETTS